MGAPRSRQTRCAARAADRILGPRPGGAVRHETDQEAKPRRMLRIVHTADVHLGARHDDLGDQASAQRERQFVAFVAAVELALAEKVDLFLVAGDLFDSNVQPRRSVERVASQLKRLAEARVRTVIIPGTHDVYDRASIYRAYDLKALSGSTATDDLVTVLTPEHRSAHLAACDVIVYGPVFATKRAPHSPFRDLDVAGDERTATWRVGLIHGSIAIPGKTERDEVVITTDEIAASGLDYLALGHWHSAQQAKVGGVQYAYAGAPEAVALDQDRAGKVLLVELDESAGQRSVRVEERQVGRTAFRKEELDATTIASQPALIEGLARAGDPDLVLDVRIVGVRPDDLDLEVDEIEAALAPSFLKVRVRDVSLPALTEGALPPPDTIAGAFIRDMEARIAEIEAAPGADPAAPASDEAAELRDALRLGRLLLGGHEVSL
jgi:exonuclease SbcD